MSENLRPGTPSPAGAIDVTQIDIVSPTDTTTHDTTFTLPTFGPNATQSAIYDFTIYAKIPDVHNAAIARGTIVYNRAAANAVATTTLASVVTSSAARGTITLEVFDPNLSGQVTFRIGWTDGTSQVITSRIRLFRLDALGS